MRLIRAQPCSNNFSCQQIPLFSVFLSVLQLVVPLNACVNAILNQLEVRLHSGRTVRFCPSLSPRLSFRFFQGSGSETVSTNMISFSTIIIQKYWGMSAFPKGYMIRLHYVHATLSLCDLLSPWEDWCPHEGQGHHQEAADVQKGRQGGEVSSELLRLQQLSLTVADEVRPVSTLYMTTCIILKPSSNGQFAT